MTRTDREYQERYRREAAARIAAQPVRRCRYCNIEVSILNDLKICGPCSGDLRRRRQ